MCTLHCMTKHLTAGYNDSLHICQPHLHMSFFFMSLGDNVTQLLKCNSTAGFSCLNTNIVAKVFVCRGSCSFDSFV